MACEGIFFLGQHPMTPNTTIMNKLKTDPTVKGFGWVSLSFICGTFFFIVSKTLLNSMKPADFFTWWYGLGLTMHLLYGLRSESIKLEDIDRTYLHYFGIYILLDITGTAVFFTAVKMMDPSIASFLNQSQIIMTLLLGFLFLKEALVIGEVLATLVIISGIVIMSFKSPSVPLLGALGIMYSNLCGASNFVIVRKIGGKMGTLTFIRIRTTFMFVIFLGFNLATTRHVEIPDAPTLTLLFLGAFFGPFLNVIALFKSLEYIPAGKLALFRSLQPIFVLIASWAILKTVPGYRESAGGFIIIFGCVLLAYLHAQHVLGIKRPLRAVRR